MKNVSGLLVALSTPDVVAAARWYEETLGFHPVKSGQMGFCDGGVGHRVTGFSSELAEVLNQPLAIVGIR